MKFTPRPENDFRTFYTQYFERCRERFGRIEGLAAKWTFEDLLPGLSDFDTRLLCADGMSADDWIEMSLAVGAVLRRRRNATRAGSQTAEPINQPAGGDPPSPRDGRRTTRGARGSMR